MVQIALPKDMGSYGMECRPLFEKEGWVFNEVENGFVTEIPKGWRLETQITFPYLLFDGNGNERALVFSSSVRMNRRYGVDTLCNATIDSWKAVCVVDRGAEIHRAGIYCNRDEAGMYKLLKVAYAWLDGHYPDWTNPGAYWE